MENSRVDGMVGGGGGRSACVITREDKGLVSLQAADVAATEQAVTFCWYELDVRSASQVMVIRVNKKITAQSQMKSLIPCS